jgi:hypothetical protein
VLLLFGEELLKECRRPGEAAGEIPEYGKTRGIGFTYSLSVRVFRPGQSPSALSSLRTLMGSSPEREFEFTSYNAWFGLEAAILRFALSGTLL